MKLLLVILSILILVSSCYAQIEPTYPGYNWTSEDKLNHFAYGAGTTFLVSNMLMVAHTRPLEYNEIRDVAIANGIFWAVVQSSGIKNTPPEKRFLWNLIGIATITGISILSKEL